MSFEQIFRHRVLPCCDVFDVGRTTEASADRGSLL